MSDEWQFEKVGSYWKLPVYIKIWWNIKYWFKGTWMFVKCLFDYKTSIIENELTIRGAWGLCHALQEVKMGKSYRMIRTSEGTAK